MELNKNKFALAASGTVGILYIVCAGLVAIAPGFVLKLLGGVAHLVNVDKFAGDVQITLTSVGMGLIQIIVYSYIAAFLFSWIYNKLVKV